MLWTCQVHEPYAHHTVPQYCWGTGPSPPGWGAGGELRLCVHVAQEAWLPRVFKLFRALGPPASGGGGQLQSGEGPAAPGLPACPRTPQAVPSLHAGQGRPQRHMGLMPRLCFLRWWAS